MSNENKFLAARDHIAEANFICDARYSEIIETLEAIQKDMYFVEQRERTIEFLTQMNSEMGRASVELDEIINNLKGGE